MEYQQVKEVLKLMPKSVSGFIESIRADVTKTGKNVGTKYWKVSLRGLDDTFFVWQWPIIADVRVGQEVDLAVDTKDDRFQRVIECVPIIRAGETEKTIEPTPPAPESVSRKPFVSSGDSKNNQYISRMSVLKTAVDFTNNKDMGCTIEDVIATAKRLFEFVETGD
jgi:hypothetical protein